jgi:hypothetical protein
VLEDAKYSLAPLQENVMKNTVKIVQDNAVKQRNPVAACLMLAQFQRKIVPNKKAYSRKSKNRNFQD